MDCKPHTAEVAVVADRRRKAEPRKDFAVLRRPGPIVRNEVGEQAIVAEMQRCGNRLSPVREPGADGPRIDRLPDDVFVEKRARSQHAHIVEQGHCFGAVHLVAAGIDDRDRTRNLDAHRGVSVCQPVEHEDRQSEHAGAHEKEARRLVREALLLGDEGHPRGVGCAANASAKSQIVVLHARSADHSRASQMPLHRVGETGNVQFGDHGSSKRPCQASGGLAAELGAEAPGSLGQEYVEDADEKHQRRNHPNHGQAAGSTETVGRRIDCATTPTASTVAMATPANSAHAPLPTSSGDSRNMPAPTAGTPIVHPRNTMACSVRSRMRCGDGASVERTQNQAASGRSRASIPTTICARKPSSPNTPYAAATRRLQDDKGITTSASPRPIATSSDAPAAAACRTAKSTFGAPTGFSAGERTIQATLPINVPSPDATMITKNSVQRLWQTSATNRPRMPPSRRIALA